MSGERMMLRNLWRRQSRSRTLSRRQITPAFMAGPLWRINHHTTRIPCAALAFMVIILIYQKKQTHAAQVFMTVTRVRRQMVWYRRRGMLNHQKGTPTPQRLPWHLWDQPGSAVVLRLAWGQTLLHPGFTQTFIKLATVEKVTEGPV